MHRQGSEWTVIPAKMYDITVFTSSIVEIISEQLHIKWAFPNHFLQLFDSYAPETQICHRPQRFFWQINHTFFAGIAFPRARDLTKQGDCYSSHHSLQSIDLPNPSAIDYEMCLDTSPFMAFQPSWLRPTHRPGADFVLLQVPLCWLHVTEVAPAPPSFECQWG